MDILHLINIVHANAMRSFWCGFGNAFLLGRRIEVREFKFRCNFRGGEGRLHELIYGVSGMGGYALCFFSLFGVRGGSELKGHG